MITSLATKLGLAIMALTIAATPLAASAQQWGVRIGVGNGVVVHAGNGYYPRRYYYDGYYGWAPAGFQGYYWHGGWYHHRRWHNGIWIYF